MGKTGRPGSGIESKHVVDAAIKGMSEPALNDQILSWEKLTTILKELYPQFAGAASDAARIKKYSGDASTPGSNRTGMIGDVLEHLGDLGGTGYQKLRRRGVGENSITQSAKTAMEEALRQQLTDPRSIANLAHPVALEAFKAAYLGSIGDSPIPSSGSSHRLRFILIAHHQNIAVRKILEGVLEGQRFQNYVKQLETIVEQVPYNLSRQPKAVINDLTALLDGYLIKAVSEVKPDGDKWAAAYADSVVEMLACTIYHDPPITPTE